MTPPSSNNDPFPPSEFDQWARDYDQEVTGEGFPFTGYHHTLAEVVRLAEASAGMSVLDVGTGTGNLAELFVPLGCQLWCTDFSAKMLEIAREKLPLARFFQHDLRQPFPAALTHRFDRIVSAYVFHHFELPEKVAICQRLVREQLAPGGRLVIADISFPNPQALDAVRQSAGDQWDDEPYWIAASALPALESTGLSAGYLQTSNCAGVYLIQQGAAGI